MKNYFIFFSFLAPFLMSHNIYGQGLGFSYDVKGNRIERYPITWNIDPSAKAKVSNDSLYLLYKDSTNYSSSIGNIRISIFPNPTSNDLLVHIDGAPKEIIIKIIIFSAIGREVFRNEDFHNGQKFDFSGQPNGNYILTVVHENKLENFKIIKK